ncbi:MAG: organoarsenical effux MFS transporter ArsJ, partial [Rhodospirillales bacterium]|nr:organoarsenical effux MFS transporter ArsJ [Rhodospirillales bacterium]
MGIFTNFIGGWIGAKHGLKLTLFTGLIVQIGALIMLSGVQPHWALDISVIYVMAAQAFSGVAKDLTKMSAKSAVKRVVPEKNQGLLFRWIALLTGSKNALKGVGFLLGGVLLQFLGFHIALWSLAVFLILVLLAARGLVTADLGRASQKITPRDLFSKKREINFLSIARVFLFASRDVWFVVGVPIFLARQFGWSFDQIGGFMAAWVIGYGVIQAVAPKLLTHVSDAGSGARAAKYWGTLLCLIPLAIAAGLTPAAVDFWADGLLVKLTLISGLCLFGIIFAINSSVHSFLIVAYSDRNKIALNVGFYYMANAAGRLLGTLLSGIVFQFYGLAACLLVSGVMIGLAVLMTLPLSQASGR